MSTEKLQSVQPSPPAEAPECNFDDLVCVDPESYYDYENGVCEGDEYAGRLTRNIEKEDAKKALKNKAKNFKKRKKVKREPREEVDRVAVISRRSERKIEADNDAPAASGGSFFSPQEAPLFPESHSAGEPSVLPPSFVYPLIPFDVGLLLYFPDLPEKTLTKKKTASVLEEGGEFVFFEGIVRDGFSLFSGQSEPVARKRETMEGPAVLETEKFLSDSIPLSIPEGVAANPSQTNPQNGKEGKERMKAGEESAPLFETSLRFYFESFFRKENEDFSPDAVLPRDRHREGEGFTPFLFQPMRQGAERGLPPFFVFPFFNSQWQGAVTFEARLLKFTFSKVNRGSDSHNSGQPHDQNQKRRDSFN